MDHIIYNIITVAITVFACTGVGWACFQAGKTRGFLEGHDEGMKRGKSCYQHPMIRKYCERETSKN